MMKNFEVYEKDPRSHELLNQGVAKVTSGQSDKELKTLRYELTNFVCDGQYAKGLDRILSNFLGQTGDSEQPGVWVSGFYGSGKSHLVKMLQYLWTDFEFQDGAKARGLVKLPQNIQAQLKELTTAAKPNGGLHVAAGDLRSEGKESFRLTVLSIVLKSLGLPEDYSRACFQMWLRDEGIEPGVREFIIKAGGDFVNELRNLFASDLIFKAILEQRPNFAPTIADVPLILMRLFKDEKEITIDELIFRIKQAFGNNGKIPYMILILDEVQQYINDDASRSNAVQSVKEQCCSKLGANFLLIGTGQNALSATPLLQKLIGRFPVSVELEDTDVNQVLREVVLKKKPTAEAELKKLLDDHIGEIERQLASTKIGSSSNDRSLLVKDYPILPVRRRFWERVLRAVDKTGTGAQLRNQLWVVFDAVHQSAEWPLGNVVSGAFIYDASIKSAALKSGTLLQEIATTINNQKNENDGELRYQICALIFLIGQLPHNNEPGDAGIRAEAEAIADLLVTDLTRSSSDLRKKVPELLEKLVASGAIMQVENEYRMQTQESSEWNQMFIQNKNKLMNDTVKLAGERSQLLRTKCSDFLKKFKLLHGASNESREIDLQFGDVALTKDGTTIPVWIRDGWEVEEKSVKNDARAAGDSAPIVYGFIPKYKAEELKQAIASCHAASATLQAKGQPTGDEGIHARKAIETQEEQSLKIRDSLIQEIINNIQVYLAGGQEIGGPLFSLKIQEAASLCLDRLFPLFGQADSEDWPKVLERAKKGDGDALTVVGHKGDPENHLVCKAVLDFVGSGKKGPEVRNHFKGGKYGWSQDAIDAALIVLCNSGAILARLENEPVTKGKIDQKNITTIQFRCETVILTVNQLIELRGLFKKLKLKTSPNQESNDAPKFLQALLKLAESVGGESPLPMAPDTASITDLQNKVGNDQLKAIHEQKDELSQWVAEWQKNHDLVEKRMPMWMQLMDLFPFASDLSVSEEIGAEIETIKNDRKLLANPNPVPSIVEKLTSSLRIALNDAYEKFSTDYEVRLAALTETPNWKQISQPQRYQILDSHSIRVKPTVAVGTTDEVLHTLRQTKLSELRAMSDALPARFGKATVAAAKLLEPQAQHVSLPGGTIKTEEELKAWLTGTESLIRSKLKDGPVTF